MKGGITHADQNAGEGDYLWTFDAPLTGSEALDSFTFEKGDETQAYEIAYCLARSMNISIDCESSEVHLSADLFGDKVSQTTITGGLSEPTAELMNGKLCRLYIDDSWAALGTTELTSTLVSAEINIEGGAHPKHLGSSSQLFSAHGQGYIVATITLTLERNASVAAEELHFRPTGDYTPDMRCIRLTLTGDQIGAGDSQTLQVDMAGVYTSWQSIGDE